MAVQKLHLAQSNKSYPRPGIMQYENPKICIFFLQDGFAPPEEIDGDNPHPPEEDEY